MRFANQISTIKSHQDKLVSVEKNIKEGCSKLKKNIEKIIVAKLKEAFPSTKFIDLDWMIDVDGACMTNRWKPEVFFVSVSNYELSKKGFWFQDTIDRYQKVNPPVNTREFLTFLKDLSKELGIKCTMCRTEPRWATEKVAAQYDADFGGDDL